MKKSPDDEFEARWTARLRVARADVPPPIDRAALLRVVRAEPAPVRAGWLAELAALFSVARLVPACLGAAAAVAIVTTWQVWDTWQALPWAQLLGTVTGGGQ